MKIALAKAIAAEFSTVDVRLMLTQADVEVTIIDEEAEGEQVEITFDIEKFRSALVDKLIHI